MFPGIDPLIAIFGTILFLFGSLSEDGLEDVLEDFFRILAAIFRVL